MSHTETSRPTKTPDESSTFLAEIVGEESLLGERMSAGKLLHMMDLAAAGAAARHSKTPVVTLAFDRIELLEFICHMDYVRYEAQVISVGRSSMLIKIDGYSKTPTEMEIHPGHGGMITMVAIGADGKPNRDIPGLRYETNADLQKKSLVEARERLLRNRAKMIKRVDAMTEVDPSLLKDYYPRIAYFRPGDTELRIRKKFLPRNANSLGNVFGGDTVEMMEELALAVARQFTGNFRMVTIAMEDVLFLKPLHLDDWVEMQARVVYVANTTLVVTISVRSINFFSIGESVETNSGTFTILNYDRSGRKKSIPNGLDMRDASVFTKQCYLKEQIKYEKRTGKKSKTDGCGDPNEYRALGKRTPTQ